uniref:Glycoprotein B n=40 Tax=Chelonid alphaherpesvirus 5 TaxID=702736 RepID=A0A6B9RE13_9ALPH|nr:glycoprotein B [Chelonid alphaherpesvirus 5]QHH25912.1 glycoprotein B [Chelonid alphaherpesvirus 5]QHH25913.1 glycoprotein B [Chelonid alphaherpesvirus 5]QHH25914.1 glycoprotein B [Chelonid alphaherpesvirus 5]QHH25916.1 glycoprotein B [Chelonid alphaherpesvirus 5]
MIIVLLLFCGATFAQPSGNDEKRNLTLSDMLKRVNLGESAVEDFEVCGLSAGSDLVRFEGPRKCRDMYTDQQDYEEGIMLVWKENITPYIFNVSLFYKEVTIVRSYQTFLGEKQIWGSTMDRYPVDVADLTRIESNHTCGNSATAIKHNSPVTMWDNNDNTQEWRQLQRAPKGTPSTRIYRTMNFTHVNYQWVWERESVTVNCLVVDTVAKSPYPYDFMAVATGDTVEMSPFYNTGAKNETMNEDLLGFVQIKNFQRKDRETGETRTSDRNFQRKAQSYYITWDAVNRTQATCTLKLWQTVPETVRVIHSSSYHFTAQDLTSTLVVPSGVNFSVSELSDASCVTRDSQKLIDDIFDSRYNLTHARNGSVQYFLATGGFVIAYQALTPLNIDSAVNNTRARARSTPAPAPVRSRVRRQALERTLRVVNSARDATFTQVQFTYDVLRQHINSVFSRLVNAWCELQNRDVTVWELLLNIKASSVMSTVMGKRVAAKKMGDLVAVSKCLKVNSANVKLWNTMYITDGPYAGRGLCWSRPVVVFSLSDNANQEDLITGHLGEHNELLPYLGLTESCEQNSRKYFMFGGVYMLYENYHFVRPVTLDEITEVRTFVEFNVSLLPDYDIQHLEVYSQEEIKLSNPADYLEVTRFQNAYLQLVNDLKLVVYGDASRAFIARVQAFFGSLGTVGEALGKVIGVVGGALAGVLNGIVGFLTNPFGGFTILLLVGGGLIAAFLALKFVQTFKKNPLSTIFPVSANQGQWDPKEPLPELSKKRQQEINDFLRDLSLQSEAERREKKAASSSGWSLAKEKLSNVKDNFTDAKNKMMKSLRHRGNGYAPVSTSTASMYLDDELSTYSQV